MERRIKERLTGAAILIMLGVIFIPMILDNSIHTDTTIEETNIPERPGGSFDSRPLPPDEPVPRPASKPQPEAESAPESESEPEPGPEPVSSVKPEEEAEPAASAGEETEKQAEQKEEKAPAPAPAAEEKPQQPKQEAKAAESGRAEEAEPATKTPRSEAKSRGLTAWVVQIGSFSREDNANNLVKKLQNMGYPAFIEPLKQDSGTVYRVRIGPELLRSDASALREKLEQEVEMEGIVVEYP